MRALLFELDAGRFKVDSTNVSYIEPAKPPYTCVPTRTRIPVYICSRLGILYPVLDANEALTGQPGEVSTIIYFIEPHVAYLVRSIIELTDHERLVPEFDLNIINTL